MFTFNKTCKKLMNTQHKERLNVAERNYIRVLLLPPLVQWLKQIELVLKTLIFNSAV